MEAYQRCDPLFIHLNSAESNFTSALFTQRQKELKMEVRDHPWTYDQFDWDAYPTLGQLVSGQAEGRTDDAQITAFVNNVGAGAQFAAVGTRVYELAISKGIGQELDSDLFLEDMHP
jgi:ornithine cyclodeaminase/alanine dehydrogenase-like protein (mu-crystallin family)